MPSEKTNNNENELRQIITAAEEIHFEDYGTLADIDPDTLSAHMR